MSAVAALLKQFDKAVAKLEKLADRNRTEAGVKTAMADALDVQAGQLLDEADAAPKAANRLKDILEAQA